MATWILYHIFCLLSTANFIFLKFFLIVCFSKTIICDSSVIIPLGVMLVNHKIQIFLIILFVGLNVLISIGMKGLVGYTRHTILTASSYQYRFTPTLLINAGQGATASASVLHPIDYQPWSWGLAGQLCRRVETTWAAGIGVIFKNPAV